MALGLHDLGSESLWYDELWAVRIARTEPLEIMRASLGDNNPPYVISTALLVYTHFYGTLFVAAQIICVLASRENLRSWLYGGSLPFDHYFETTHVNAVAFLASKNAGMRKTVPAMVAGRDRVWLVIFCN